MIKKKINNEVIFIRAYFTIIEEDSFVDFMCFTFGTIETICLSIDSTGENISIINVNEMNESIKRTAIHYKNEILRSEIFLKEIYYFHNKHEQLEKIHFIFESEVLEVTLGMDSLNYEFSQCRANL